MAVREWEESERHGFLQVLADPTRTSVWSVTGCTVGESSLMVLR